MMRKSLLAAAALALTRSEAIAQAAGGVRITGSSDPVTTMNAALLLFLSLCGGVIVAAWAIVGLSHINGHGVEPRRFWGAVIATVILGGCGIIAATVLGGGGIGGL